MTMMINLKKSIDAQPENAAEKINYLVPVLKLLSFVQK